VSSARSVERVECVQCGARVAVHSGINIKIDSGSANSTQRCVCAYSCAYYKPEGGDAE
jgi:hypothetical protein